jgi:hypothetical protein
MTTQERRLLLLTLAGAQGLKARLLVWREGVTEPSERIPGFLAEAIAVAQVFRRPPRGDA